MIIQERINKLKHEVKAAELQLKKNIKTMKPLTLDNVSSSLHSSSLSMRDISLPLFSLGSMLLLGRNKKLYTITKVASTVLELVRKIK